MSGIWQFILMERRSIVLSKEKNYVKFTDSTREWSCEDFVNLVIKCARFYLWQILLFLFLMMRRSLRGFLFLWQNGVRVTFWAETAISVGKVPPKTKSQFWSKSAINNSAVSFTNYNLLKYIMSLNRRGTLEQQVKQNLLAFALN